MHPCCDAIAFIALPTPGIWDWVLKNLYHFRKGRESVFAEIFNLQSEMDRRGIDFRVVLMPIFEGDNASLKYPIMDMHTEIIAALADTDIPVIDLLGGIRECRLAELDICIR